MPEPPNDDPVVAEIHAIRAKMLADCGGDRRKLLEQVREREQASKTHVIPVPPPPQHGTGDSVAPTLVPIENADMETVALSTNREFLDLIERSRVSALTEGGISSKEMRRRFEE
jgi:hypothetical protein